MRFAAVSDIHGNLPALEAVVRDIKRRGVDGTVNLGDSLSGPLLPLETAQFLMAQDWVHLAGNHERQILFPGRRGRNASDAYAHSQLTERELDWLVGLEHRQPLGKEVLLCHGTPRSDIEYFLETVEPGLLRLARPDEIDARLGEETAAIVLCGHSHVARAVRASAGTLIVNPGSVGQPAYDDDEPYRHVIETGSPDARYAIVEYGLDGWMASLHAVPYDPRPMAQLAIRNDRPEWAFALLSGRMA
jgi:predicted phosphodiesterase